MKRMLMMFALLPLLALADTWTDPDTGITWTYTVSGGEANVDGNGQSAIPKSTTGAITIPSTLGDCPVTSINRYAFFDCSELTSVTIPSGVTSIGDAVFRYCRGLTSVTIPPSVTSIGDYAFSGCSGLTSIEMSKGVTNIGDSAFSGCSGLRSVTIPKGVTSIGVYAFQYCSGLTSVTIPDSVTSISSYAFQYCSGLTSVTIPKGVTSIGGSAFSGCSGLKDVTVPGWKCGMDFSSVTNLTISEGTTSIGYAAFSYCGGLTSVTIPSSVTSIGSFAFYGCSGLTSVDFEGAPLDGLSAAGVKTDAVVRYNIAYEDEWLPVIEECGFTNARPYVPGVGDMTKADIDAWVGSTLAPKFKGAGETAADYRKRFEAKFGEDCVAAFFMETGKVGRDGTNLQVWHDYVAGTDPLNTNDVFTATITFDEKGVPKVEYKPTFEDPDEAAKRKYTTYGKKSLADEKWEEVAEGREADYNFFKVTVEMAK